MSLLFISDLHLKPERPDLVGALLGFLKQKAPRADQLYILGDFFEFWIGDDFKTPETEALAAALKSVSDQGTEIFFQHGNRDFMVGNDFATQAGMTLLEEAVVISPYGKPLLLMHGDQLCLEDVEYQKFRQMVRNPAWQKQMLATSIEERLALARSAREASQTAGAGKSDEIMDVSPDEVTRVMLDKGVDTLIHGHTHRPAEHKVSLGENEGSRIVLGDWDKQGWFLEYRADNSHELVSFPIN